jgi:hypothetical protein
LRLDDVPVPGRLDGSLSRRSDIGDKYVKTVLSNGKLAEGQGGSEVGYAIPVAVSLPGDALVVNLEVGTYLDQMKHPGYVLKSAALPDTTKQGIAHRTWLRSFQALRFPRLAQTRRLNSLDVKARSTESHIPRVECRARWSVMTCANSRTRVVMRVRIRLAAVNQWP